MESKEFNTTISELDEIILNIFGYFGVADTLKVSLVCKRWNRISKDNTLWRSLVLKRWPSQRPILGHVSKLALEWQKVYRHLSDQGRYSPDDMKYFIICKVGGQNYDSCSELREAVLRHMDEVTSSWEKPGLYELEETSPRFFNGNMELYYDTHDLKWVFVDRRREYVDDSFTIRLNLNRMTSRQMRYIRPYQVMASCVMMYRWLMLFKQMFTEDIGLTFYRIWRFRLKHIKTGFIFETYDWKAAMSSTFSHGCPLAGTFRDAGLAVLNMLSSPFFVMHPMGNNAYKIWYEIPLMQDTDSDQSSRNISRTSSFESLSSASEIPAKVMSQSSSSDTLSSTKSTDEAESDNGDDWGYYCNCESFIHRSSWEYEEQQLTQAETASKWEVILLQPTPTFEVIFDSSEEKWLFSNYCQRNPIFPDVMNRILVDLSLDSMTQIKPSSSLEVPEKIALSPEERCYSGDCIYGQEAMPTSLTLYRLICMFDLNSMHYRSLDEKSVWEISLQHKVTRAIMQLKDLNGWLRVHVTFNDELKLFCNDLALMSLNENIGYFTETNLQSECNKKDEAVGCSKDTQPSTHSKEGIKTDQDKGATATEYTTNPMGTDQSEDTMGTEHGKDGQPLDSSAPSEGSEEEYGNPLERFKNDVCSLLQLLINQKFAHPYGTVAGAVA